MLLFTKIQVELIKVGNSLLDYRSNIHYDVLS